MEIIETYSYNPEIDKNFKIVKPEIVRWTQNPTASLWLESCNWS